MMLQSASDGDMLAKYMFATNVKKVVNRMPKVAYANDLSKIRVEERRCEGNHEREKNKLWRLLYQNHLSLQDSLLVNRQKLTLFGRSVVATPTPSATPQTTSRNSPSSTPWIRSRSAAHVSNYKLANKKSNPHRSQKDDSEFKKRSRSVMQELLDCMPGNDGSLPLNDVQAREAKQRAVSAGSAHQKAESRTTSGKVRKNDKPPGIVLPKIITDDVTDDVEQQQNQSDAEFTSSRHKSRFDVDTDAYIPPKVMTLRLARPDTTTPRGQFTKINIDDGGPTTVDLNTKVGEKNEEKDLYQNGPVKDITQVRRHSVPATEESTHERDGDLQVPNPFASVRFKSAPASDRGLKVVPIHLIKHQTAPLITEEQIQEQKTLRQKYLSRKDCHCYRSFIAQEDILKLNPIRQKVNISAEMRRQLRQQNSSIVGRDTFALPLELTREFHVFKLQTQRLMKQDKEEENKPPLLARRQSLP